MGRKKPEITAYGTEKTRNCSLWDGKNQLLKNVQRKTTMSNRPPENIMRCHNDLCDIPLLNLTANQANIFMVICYEYQRLLWTQFEQFKEKTETIKKIESIATKNNITRKEAEKLLGRDVFSYVDQSSIPPITLEFAQLKKLINYRKGGSKKLADDLRETNRRLLCINITNITEQTSSYTNTEQFGMFDTFKTLENEKKLLVTIDRRFARMLFALERTYTDNNVREFVSLKSINSKNLYRQLSRWSSTGRWNVSMKDFRYLMGIPDTRTHRHVRQDVIKPACKELQEFFPKLSYTIICGKDKGNPAERIEFTFTPKAKSSTYKDTGFVCPDCGQSLFEKQINGQTQWMHKDGWKEDAKCKRIFHSVAEIEGYSEQSEREPRKSGEAEEAIKRLSEILSMKE